MATFYYLAGLAANLATTATITTSSEDSNYDADNVGVGWPAKEYRQASAVTNGTVSFDLASAMAPTFFSVHGHNFDDLTSVTLLSDDNPGFSSPVTEATITTYTQPSFFKIITSPTSHRYWRIGLNGTNSAAAKIGEVGLGVASTLFNVQLDRWTYSDEWETLGDEDFAENKSDHERRTVKLTFVAESYSDRDEIRAIRRSCKGRKEPFLFIPDENDTMAIHGRIIALSEWERIPGPSNGYHKTTMTVREDPFALALT